MRAKQSELAQLRSQVGVQNCRLLAVGLLARLGRDDGGVAAATAIAAAFRSYHSSDTALLPCPACCRLPCLPSTFPPALLPPTCPRCRLICWRCRQRACWQRQAGRG